MVEIINTRRDNRELTGTDEGQRLYEYYSRVINFGNFPATTYARHMRAIEAMAEVSDPKYRGGIFPGLAK